MTDAYLPLPRDLAAASALRQMVIGCIGVLCGGVFVLCAAFGLGGPVSSGTGLQRDVALVLGGAIAVLAGFSFVRGLVAHEELRRGADAFSIVLVTLVTVPLTALGLGGYAHTHPPDKQLRAAELPYTFEYPGAWERDPQPDTGGFAGDYEFVDATAVGRRGLPTVLVMAYVPPSRSALEEWVRLAGTGTRTVNERTVQMAGRPAIMVDYEIEAQPGKPFQAQAAVMRGRVAYVVTCVLDFEPDEAREGCQQVIDTFRFTAGPASPAAPGTAAPAA